MPSPAPLTDDDIDAVCEALLAFYASPMACWRLSGDRFGAHKRHTLTAPVIYAACCQFCQACWQVTAKRGLRSRKPGVN